MRSFARARSSSRRAPPNAASKPCSSIASSSVVGLQPVARGARAGLLDDAAVVDRLLHGGDDQPLAELGDAAVAELDHLGEVVAGVDVHDRERERAPGRNAFSARRSSTIESLPPQNSSTGRSSSAATSRMMWIASASRRAQVGRARGVLMRLPGRSRSAGATRAVRTTQRDDAERRAGRRRSTDDRDVDAGLASAAPSAGAEQHARRARRAAPPAGTRVARRGADPHARERADQDRCRSGAKSTLPRDQVRERRRPTAGSRRGRRRCRRRGAGVRRKTRISAERRSARREPTEVMPSTKPSDARRARRRRPCAARVERDACRARARRVGMNSAPREDRQAPTSSSATATHDQQRRRRSRRRSVVQRGRAATTPSERARAREPTASHIDTPRSTVPCAQVPPAADGLGDRAVGEVGADRRRPA